MLLHTGLLPQGGLRRLLAIVDGFQIGCRIGGLRLLSGGLLSWACSWWFGDGLAEVVLVGGLDLAQPTIFVGKWSQDCGFSIWFAWDGFFLFGFWSWGFGLEHLVWAFVVMKLARLLCILFFFGPFYYGLLLCIFCVFFGKERAYYFYQKFIFTFVYIDTF